MHSTHEALLAQIPRPSVARRVVLAGALLVGFVVSTLGLALVLVLLPVVYVWVMYRSGKGVGGEIGIFSGLAWACAGVLVLSLRRLVAKDPEPDGRVLAEVEAPGLFEEVRAVCAAVGIAAPSEIRLTPDLDLSVAEVHGRRVLFLGAALVARARVVELRAGVAHEMGHFAFGDTRFGRLYGAVNSFFRGAAELVDRREKSGGLYDAASAQVLGAVVGRYVRLYLNVTRPTSRRMELAADELAVRLVGAAPLGDVLRRLSVERPLYQVFLVRHVARAVQVRALPSDLVAVFSRFLGHAGQAELVADLARAAYERSTDPFDAHPSLAERAAAAARVEASLVDLERPRWGTLPDDAPASSLLAVDVDTLVVEHLASLHAHGPPGAPPLVRAPFAALPREVYAPFLLRGAQELAQKLAPAHPWANSISAHFAAVVRALHHGQLEAFATHLEPRLAQVAIAQRAAAVVEVAVDTITYLFLGALLERGAVLEEDLGEAPLAGVWNGERVLASALVRRSMSDAAAAHELTRWASRLAA